MWPEGRVKLSYAALGFFCTQTMLIEETDWLLKAKLLQEYGLVGACVRELANLTEASP